MDGKKSRGLMKFPRLASLATSALFLFFLIYSVPVSTKNLSSLSKAHIPSYLLSDPFQIRAPPEA